MLLENLSSYPKFVKWFTFKKEFWIKKSINTSGLITNYEFSHETIEEGDNNTIWNVTRNFETTDGELADSDEFAWTRTEIREYYDKWRRDELNKILKRSGLITGIELTIIALITALSLGLKRSGNDIIHAAPTLKPATKTESRKEIEDIAKKTTGGSLIFIGDHICITIGGTL